MGMSYTVDDILSRILQSFILFVFCSITSQTLPCRAGVTF